jgi:hypothetical protein
MKNPLLRSAWFDAGIPPENQRIQLYVVIRGNTRP